MNRECDCEVCVGAMTRRGLVLGGGGVLGYAWLVGALTALQERVGVDAREFDMYVGVSSGAISSTLLASGVGVDVMVRNVRGAALPDDPATDYDESSLAGADGRLPKPGWGLGSPGLIANAARRPGSVPPLAMLSGALPPGKGTLDPIRKVINEVAPDGWPDTVLWIVAMDYESGNRVVFGRNGDPQVPLSEAVAASCAIPGWFSPVELDGHRYVDGGMYSNTSADLFAGQGMDEVYVIAPMASFQVDEPASVMGKLERRWRRAVTRRLNREIEKVRASGTKVYALGPGPADLTAMGANLMDPTHKSLVCETSLKTSATALRMLGVGT